MADFFGKMKDTLNKGVATVSTGSKTMIEKSKMNSCIKTLEDEIKQLSEIMGMKLYNYCATNPDGDIPRAEFVSFCSEISNRNEQIKQYRAKIAELDAEMNQVTGSTVSNVPVTCSCGQVNSPGAKFCAKCGKQLF